jgi:hypothetical protein
MRPGYPRWRILLDDPMKRLLFILIAGALATSLSKADQSIIFPGDSPLIGMAFPDEWELKSNEGILYAHPKDDAAYFMSLSTLEATSDDPEAAMLEAKTQIAESFENVEYTEPQTFEAGGLDVMLVNAKGQDQDGVANINLWMIAKKGTETVVMLKCVSTQEAFEQYAELGAEVINTIAAYEGDVNLLTYSYPDEANPAFTFSYPEGWGLAADEAGAYLEAPDKLFTLNVVPIDMEHVADGMTNIMEQVSAKYDSVVWNEGGEPEVQIDEASGNTLIISNGVGTGGGIEHKLGVFQYAKKGAAKFFVLSTWAEMEEVEANFEAAQAIFNSIELN